MRYIGVVLLAFLATVLNAQDRVEPSALVAVQMPNASADDYLRANAYASRLSESEVLYPLNPVVSIQSPNAIVEEKVQVLEPGIFSGKIAPSSAQSSIPALLWIFGSVVAGFFAMLSTGSLSARQI